ncbi:MAG: hypothetical protein ACO22X_12000 [Algoriphagus sp.]
MPTALGDLSFAFFLAPLANQQPCPAQPPSHPATQPMNWLDTVESCLRRSLAVGFL